MVRTPTSQSNKIGWAFGLGLERIAMVLFGIPDIRLFWSKDERFTSQFTSSDKIVKFQPFSKHPSCTKDISFWLNNEEDGREMKFHENNFCEIVRAIAADLVEDVKLVDDFINPKTKKRSLCYRINYRSMDRTCTNEEINDIQEKVRNNIEKELNVTLR
ncbi:11372_t:CDS:2 [Entrophospora sp. SA101]|nr:11372_t:CDS:2 [Entrophospora sp. SA101]